MVADATPALHLDRVAKTYRIGEEHVRVLVDCDLTVRAGEFVVITGPSGAGKSTLLHVAGGLDAPDRGTVSVSGHDLWSMNGRARAAFRRRHLGFVFQFFNLVPTMSAWENVALPRLLDSQSLHKAKPRAIELLERVGLGERTGPPCGNTQASIDATWFVLLLHVAVHTQVAAAREGN